LEIAMFNAEHVHKPTKSWKAPLKAKHIWEVRTRLTIDHRVRALALFNLAIDSKLRGCDLVKLRLNEVIAGVAIRTRSTVIQQETSRPVPFELTEPTRDAITNWMHVCQSAANNGSDAISLHAIESVAAQVIDHAGSSVENSNERCHYPSSRARALEKTSTSIA
jgi:hypothetical protein